MPVLNVGVNSTFEQQRQIINSISVDVFTLSSTLSGLTTTGLVVTYSNVAGVATYASVAGISTYAIVSGISSYAVISGVATVANYAQVAGIASALNFIPNYSHNAGVASYAPVAGFATVANYATSSSSSTFAFYAGISTYAGTAGIATVAQGISGTPNVQVGIITASLFVGNGSQLTGVNTNFVSSIGIQSSGTTIGVGITQLNFVGTGNTFAVNGTTVNISIAGGGSGSGIGLSISDTPPANTTTYPLWYSSLLGRSFVYYNDGDSSQWVDFSPTSSGGSVVSGGSTSQWVTIAAGIHTLSNVGIGTTNPTSKLTVSGDALINGITVGRGGSAVTNNTAIGSSALYSNTTGGSNVANGFGALQSNTTGDYNTAIGSNALNLNTSTSANYNTGIGASSGFAITTGSKNTILGSYTGNQNGLDIRTSNNNVVLSDGDGNIRFYANSSGNVGIGTTNPTSKLTVSGNVSIVGVATITGDATINYLTIGHGGNNIWDNTALGTYALAYNSIATPGNTAVGYAALIGNTTGINNTGLGDLVLGSNSSGSNNTANGYYALYSATGSSNVAVGAGAGQSITTGSKNTLLGRYDGNQNGLDIRTSNNNVVLSDGDGNIRFYANSSGNVGLGTTNPTSKLTVSGNVLVSGVSTLTSNVSVGGTISINGGVKLETNNATIVGTSGSTGEIKRIAGAPFFYDGSAWREFVLSSGTPVTVPADTEWNNVAFRATFDTNFTDAKFGANPVYVSAGSTIVGAAVTIGTGAFRNDGAVGSGISYAYRSEYDFTGSWTIEFWMYVDSNPDNNVPESLVSMHSVTGIGTSGNWALIMKEDQYANKYISWYNQNHPSYINGTGLYSAAGVTWNSIIRDKWNHFTLVRESNNGTLHFYVNGTEQGETTSNTVIDNDILDINVAGLHFGGDTSFTVGVTTFNSNSSADVIFDDVRISTGVGTAGQRYTSIGISTYATFTPSATALPTTGTLSSYVQPPGDKYGEIVLGGSPTWRGTSGVTVSQQSSGNYRVSFASTYTNSNDYFVLSHAMDQGFASYVGIARSTTHVDFSINKESDNAVVNTGSLAVQIKNHP